MIPEVGAMRNRITIQQTTQTQDTDGSVIDTWSTFASPYAEIVPISGSEDYIAQGITASVVYRVTCRYISGVVPKMRISYGDRVLLIYSVRNIDEKNKYLVMSCGELDV